MKPRTKIHHEVVALSHKLPRVTKEQSQWAYDKLFKFWAWKTKHKACCFECGHEWKVDTNLISKLFGVDCPKCGKTLEVTDTKHWHKEEYNHFSIVTTFEGFQLIRVFEINHYCKKGYKAHYGTWEIYQHWIPPKGKQVIMALNVNAMGGWRSGHTAWCYGSSFEIRNADNNRYYLNGISTVPRVKILPVIRRNGYKGCCHQYNMAYFFSLLLTSSKFETLLKTNQIPMLKEYANREDRINMYWQQIKICIRNHYTITQPDLWFDHLNYLQYFHKDIHNPKFICSPDLINEHQKLIEKREEIEEKNELESLKAKIEESNVQYIKDKAQFIGMKFSNGVIDVMVLNHVREFYIEGKRMHHCVFRNAYYKDKDSLVLSARRGEIHLETVEISLKQMKITQCRGLCNKDTEYHKDIIKLVSSNLPVIKNASRKRKPALVA
jgi:hypothetical protein